MVITIMMTTMMQPITLIVEIVWKTFLVVTVTFIAFMSCGPSLRCNASGVLRRPSDNTKAAQTSRRLFQLFCRTLPLYDDERKHSMIVVDGQPGDIGKEG